MRVHTTGDVYLMTYPDGSTTEETIMAIDDRIHTYESDGDVWAWRHEVFPLASMTFLRSQPIANETREKWIAARARTLRASS